MSKEMSKEHAVLSRRRAVQVLAGMVTMGVGAVAGVGALLLADRFDADPDEGRPLYRSMLGDGGETRAFLPGHGATTRYYASRVAPLGASHRLVLVHLSATGRISSAHRNIVNASGAFRLRCPLVNVCTTLRV